MKVTGLQQTCHTSQLGGVSHVDYSDCIAKTNARGVLPPRAGDGNGGGATCGLTTARAD
ncbi:protein of unknown function [Streptomyces murinus]